MHTTLPLLVAAALALGAAGCPAPAKEGQYPPLPVGCDVKVFQETPPMMTDNIGPVTATCGDDIKEEDCLRTLKDQACKLGGDVVWGVSDVPSKGTGRKQLAGRAAHSKGVGK